MTDDSTNSSNSSGSSGSSGEESLDEFGILETKIQQKKLQIEKATTENQVKRYENSLNEHKLEME